MTTCKEGIEGYTSGVAGRVRTVSGGGIRLLARLRPGSDPGSVDEDLPGVGGMGCRCR